MKKNLNEQVSRIKNMMKKLTNESFDSSNDFMEDTIDGVPVEFEEDGIKAVKWMELSNYIEQKYKDKLGNDADTLEFYDKIDELAMAWIKDHDAYLHSFWDDGEGYGSSYASAKYDGIEKAKENGKNIVVFEYNS